ncbi:hypothetical protein K8Q98_02550 [Candidatus Nomurabacteria bacterium]|nr:hypothetical protein [Candidatus Nomurabacteria bacterium]
MSFRHLKTLLIDVLVLSIIVFSWPNLVSAVSSSDIEADIIPANYTPGESIEIRLSSFATNLDSVLITWYVNGKNTSSGVGKKSLLTTAGAAGSETNVAAIIALAEGNITKNILIKPTVTVLLWQANDSYVPPFYKGKALPTRDSEIKVVAMPEIKVGGTMVDPKTMTYNWKKDYSNETESSGYGKNFFTYINDYLENSNNIDVTALTVNQQYSSNANIDISNIEPELIFYIKSPDTGVAWETAITNGYTVKNGESIVAAPYFISPKDIRRPEFAFNWSINDNPVTLQSFVKNFIPLKVEEGTSGTSKLRLDIENNSKIFQTISKEIELNF